MAFQLILNSYGHELHKATFDLSVLKNYYCSLC